VDILLLLSLTDDSLDNFIGTNSVAVIDLIIIKSMTAIDNYQLLPLMD
jgi:hypothetical protein